MKTKAEQTYTVKIQHPDGITLHVQTFTGKNAHLLAWAERDYQLLLGWNALIVCEVDEFGRQMSSPAGGR